MSNPASATLDFASSPSDNPESPARVTILDPKEVDDGAAALETASPAKKSKKKTKANKATGGSSADGALKERIKKITGTDNDLRKLSMKQMGRMLRSFGMSKTKIDTLKRWDRVHVIRDLSTKVGMGDELEGFARAERTVVSTDIRQGGPAGDGTGDDDDGAAALETASPAKKSKKKTKANKATGGSSADGALKERIKKITGTDNDLRKLSMKQMGRMLRSFGMSKAKIDTLKRWDRVHVIRDLSTKVGMGDGLEGFARAERTVLSTDIRPGGPAGDGAGDDGAAALETALETASSAKVMPQMTTMLLQRSWEIFSKMTKPGTSPRADWSSRSA